MNSERPLLRGDRNRRRLGALADSIYRRYRKRVKLIMRQPRYGGSRARKASLNRDNRILRPKNIINLVTRSAENRRPCQGHLTAAGRTLQAGGRGWHSNSTARQNPVACRIELISAGATIAAARYAGQATGGIVLVSERAGSSTGLGAERPREPFDDARVQRGVVPPLPDCATRPR